MWLNPHLARVASTGMARSQEPIVFETRARESIAKRPSLRSGGEILMTRGDRSTEALKQAANRAHRMQERAVTMRGTAGQHDVDCDIAQIIGQRWNLDWVRGGDADTKVRSVVSDPYADHAHAVE